MANPSKSLKRSQTFGSFPKDPNRQTISVDGNYFMTLDATGTPVVSPIAALGTTATPLNVPAAAVKLNLLASAAILVSEDPLMASSFSIPANTLMAFPCAAPGIDSVTANTGAIYIKAATGTAAVQFYFDCV